MTDVYLIFVDNKRLHTVLDEKIAKSKTKYSCLFKKSSIIGIEFGYLILGYKKCS